VFVRYCNEHRAWLYLSKTTIPIETLRPYEIANNSFDFRKDSKLVDVQPAIEFPPENFQTKDSVPAPVIEDITLPTIDGRLAQDGTISSEYYQKVIEEKMEADGLRRITERLMPQTFLSPRHVNKACQLIAARATQNVYKSDDEAVDDEPLYDTLAAVPGTLNKDARIHGTIKPSEISASGDSVTIIERYQKENAAANATDKAGISLLEENFSASKALEEINAPNKKRGDKTDASCVLGNDSPFTEYEKTATGEYRPKETYPDDFLRPPTEEEIKQRIMERYKRDVIDVLVEGSVRDFYRTLEVLYSCRCLIRMAKAFTATASRFVRQGL